jgi:hypothetical protein
MATQCYAAGRLDDSFGYAEAGLLAIDSGRFDPVPYAFESWVGGPYIWPVRSRSGLTCAAT